MEGDIQACVDSWSLDDRCLAAFLEGHLRMAMVCRHSPDLLAVRKALGVLELAEPDFSDDEQFLGIYSDALRILADERYHGAFEALLQNTDPEWLAHPLQRAMRHAVELEDWAHYDTLRIRWRAMPRNSHICECATNYVSNIDGLRALSRGELEDAIGFLRTAVSVAGCPHLNTGGGSVLLAHELLDRNLARREVEEHLKAVELYCETEETLEGATTSPWRPSLEFKVFTRAKDSQQDAAPQIRPRCGSED